MTLQLVVQSLEEAQQRKAERETSKRQAQEAEARAQAEHELALGLVVSGFTNDRLNGKYTPRGEFGGMPLYQKRLPTRYEFVPDPPRVLHKRVAVVPVVALYWNGDPAFLTWNFLSDFTPDAAAEHSANATLPPAAGSLTVPMGTRTCSYSVNGQWQPRSLTLAPAQPACSGCCGSRPRSD